MKQRKPDEYRGRSLTLTESLLAAETRKAQSGLRIGGSAAADYYRLAQALILIRGLKRKLALDAPRAVHQRD